MAPYIGRFAPSPTGPLHAGSLVAAMASYLDAKAHHGQWLVRIEDLDMARSLPGATEQILQTLRAFGMHWDGDVAIQSQRQYLYDQAFTALSEHIYPCGCSRREIADSQTGIATDGAAVYPGTCRNGLAPNKTARAFRLIIASNDSATISFQDRLQGMVSQHLATEVGDFVLKRADGFWAYQLAVVVDDADQKVTHVVRGSDLLDSTPRQIYLQNLLNFSTPAYLHVPVVTNSVGEKLSKQTGASALNTSDPQTELLRAAQFLGLPATRHKSIEMFWSQTTRLWMQKFGLNCK